MKTLGISLGHDSGIVLLENDKIVFAANEERFSRIKGYSGFPSLSLDYLQESDLIHDINAIAIDGKWFAPHGNDLAYRFEAPSSRLQSFAEINGLDRFF
jgi:predicted NodU family carbamoyl transferase